MAQMLTTFKEMLVFKEKSLSIDSWTFMLFNKVTTPLLVLCSLAVSARQFFGEPIRCDTGGKVIFLFCREGGECVQSVQLRREELMLT